MGAILDRAACAGLTQVTFVPRRSAGRDRSLNDEIGLQRSGGFDSLEDSNDSGRLDADAIEAADQGSEA